MVSKNECNSRTAKTLVVGACSAYNGRICRASQECPQERTHQKEKYEHIVHVPSPELLTSQLVKSDQDLKPRPNLARQCSKLSFCLCRKYKNTLCGSRVHLSTGSCASGNSRADGQRGRFRRPGAAHLDTRGFPMPQQERLRGGYVKDRELEKWVNIRLSASKYREAELVWMV